MFQTGAVQHIPALERSAEGQYVFFRLKPWSYLNINARFSALGPQIQHFLRLRTSEAAVCGIECFVGKHAGIWLFIIWHNSLKQRRRAEGESRTKMLLAEELLGRRCTACSLFSAARKAKKTTCFQYFVDTNAWNYEQVMERRRIMVLKNGCRKKNGKKNGCSWKQ